MRQNPLDQINPLNDLLPLIIEAMETWKKKHTAEEIQRKVFQTLNQSSQEIVMKLLGFDKNYGNWKLDHCNGRSGNSAAGDFLRQVQQTAVQEWLSTVTMPALSDTLREELLKEAQHTYNQRMKREICSLAIAQADKDLAAIIASLQKSNLADSFLRMQALIAQTNPGE